MVDCLRRHEAPFASHLLYTQPGVLRDSMEEERILGIAAGLAWGGWADATVVYVDRGISQGMRLGIEAAGRAHMNGLPPRPVEYRSLYLRSESEIAAVVRAAGILASSQASKTAVASSAGRNSAMASAASPSP